MSYFSGFLIELCKTLESDGQEIKISTRIQKFHFWVNFDVLSKTKTIIFKILIFATHNLIICNNMLTVYYTSTNIL